MNDLIETTSRLDDQGKVREIVGYIQSHPPSVYEVVPIIQHLLQEGRFRVSYIIAMMLENAMIHSPAASISLCAGGMLYNNPVEEAAGLAALRAQIDILTPQQHDSIYTSTLASVLPRLLETALQGTQRDEITLRVLEMLKAGSPRFRTIFDFTAAAPRLDMDGIRRVGRERSRLLAYPCPPPGAARPARRAVVAVRGLIFPDRSWSRPLDIGPRLTASLNAYGWQAAFLATRWGDPNSDYRAIIDACQRQNAEVLILDDHVVANQAFLPARAAMIVNLRQAMPSLKIVSLHLDTWLIDPEVMKQTCAMVDAIWALSPSFSLWEDPTLANKVFHLQVPHAGEYGPPERPLAPRLLFAGGVKGYNWHRAFWLATSTRLGLPIEWRLSSHSADGLSALDSYAVYMRELGEATCCFNLSMRPNQVCIITGRSFEAILSGSLLVQEASPDMDFFFTPGEHYLSFSTLPELRSIIDFITERREEAEEIRRRGYAFAREHYSDDKLVGYLDRHLFGTA